MNCLDTLSLVRFERLEPHLGRWHTVVCTGSLRRRQRSWLWRSLKGLLKWSRFLAAGLARPRKRAPWGALSSQSSRA